MSRYALRLASRRVAFSCAPASSISNSVVHRLLPQQQQRQASLVYAVSQQQQHSQVRPFSDLPVKTSSDGVVGVPINFDVASKVEGNESQIVTIQLEPGQVLRAESGAMMYMTDGVTMETTTGGGMSAGFKRMLTGQNVFISDYRYDGPEGTFGQVALGTDFPSKIVRLSVEDYGGKIVCQKGALLCASHTIDIEMEFTKSMTSGFFGGEGFVLQSLQGEGDVFVKAGGTLIRRELDEGEALRISSGCLVAITQDIDYGKSLVDLSMSSAVVSACVYRSDLTFNAYCVPW